MTLTTLWPHATLITMRASGFILQQQHTILASYLTGIMEQLEQLSTMSSTKRASLDSVAGQEPTTKRQKTAKNAQPAAGKLIVSE